MTSAYYMGLEQAGCMRMEAYQDGHLLYKDIAGNPRVYEYQYGRAVCFGSGFEHATQPSESTEAKVFLQISVGTDRFDRYWAPHLAPPNGPPLGSHEHMKEIYALLGIDPACHTGYAADGGALEESEDSSSSESTSDEDADE